MNDYESLKELLLQDEIKTIEELEEKLATLLKETQDPDLIIQRLTPVIGDLLKETIKNSSDEISKVMAPIMGDAIKEQVRTQKQTIVDALYPVMGNMIAKFVSSALKDTIDEINSKVQNNFTITAIKRKITARLKGIDESELLLRESQLGVLQSIFLIHTDSGLLIWQGTKDNKNIDEADMVSAMLSAIRSFVNEWIAKSDDTFELNTIDYGDSKIYLEVSGSCYLALVVQGEIRAKMQERISIVFGDIIEKYADVLRDFDGDSSDARYKIIGKSLEKLFDSQSQAKPVMPQTQESKFFLITTLIVVLISFIYLYFDTYQQEQKEYFIKDRFYHTPELNLYRIDVNVDGEKIILSGLLPYERLKNLAQSKVQASGLDMEIINNIVLTMPLYIPEVIQEKCALMDSVYNHQKGISLKSYFERGLVILKGEVLNILKIPEIIESYDAINGVDKVINMIKTKPAEIKYPYAYNTAESSLSILHKKALDHIITENNLKNISALYKDFKLNIFGYSDGIGNIEKNKKYALKRAENVYNYLINKGVDKEFLNITAIPYPPQEYNTSQDRREARVVKFIWSHRNDH
ncbi:MAG: OmpA family protein [Campylobacterota bacterium]|nr:OmpA family protein [Campylobacterota bacterium]